MKFPVYGLVSVIGRGVGQVMCAVALSVLLQLAGMRYGAVTLTAPFVVSVWAVTAVRRIGRRRCE